MKPIIKLIAMVAFLALALIAGHFLIYKPLIIPRLPGLHSVPMMWWLGQLAPQLIVFLLFGFALNSWRELIVFSVFAGFIQQTFYFLLWTWNEPGHLKSFESPVFDWTVGLLALMAMSALFFASGFVVSAAMKRNWKLA